jgi:ornithine cyclodeaminase/alanine dehydrogenase-like protein (mu-crystallin family)
LVVLFSSENGEPLAILPDGVMQRIRVGATNGLGVKYLARKDATSVGILGSGWHAGAQLMAVCAVREIETIRYFSPDSSHCETFAREMSAVLGVVVEPVAQPEDAIGAVDIAMCATNSVDNVFFERWIKPGMHLSSIKVPEIEIAAIKRADRLVIHTHDAKPFHVTTKDLMVPETEENKAAGRRNRLQAHANPPGRDRRQGCRPSLGPGGYLFHQQSRTGLSIRCRWSGSLPQGEK